MLRKILVSAVCLAMSAVVAQAGDCKFGVGPGVFYATQLKSMGVGVRAQPYFDGNHIRSVCSLNYFFEKDGVSMFELNADAHYQFNITDKFHVYPLAGFVLDWVHVNTSTKVDVPKGFEQYVEDNSESSTKSYFGVNIGGGIEYLVTPHIGVGIEGKYSYLYKIDQGVVGLYVNYIF